MDNNRNNGTNNENNVMEPYATKLVNPTLQDGGEQQPRPDVESSEEEEDDNSDDDCGSYSTPPEYKPSPPRSRRCLEEDDPEYDPVADHQEVATFAPQPSATTASCSNPKRKHGKQSRNQIPDKGTLVIEELDAKGEPILPEVISARFQNICGVIIREKLQNWITTSNWKKVPTTTKDVLWATVKERFNFPEGQEKFKGKYARDDFVKIPIDMWEEFKQQKNTLEAKALSEENTAKAMKAAENPHHLGAGGYVAKIAKWRREEVERRRACLPNMFVGLDERSRNWVLA
uniref:Transposase Tnp1/En/Spm-like domain-containing protein n=1 Tax=Setaria italica TaxID=4555 RepID=K3ZL37_SETIT